MGRKILVTGGAGFIGRHLVDKLIELGHEVVVIDNLSKGKEKKANLPAGEIQQERHYQLYPWSLDAPEVEEIFRKGVDIVVHLAAQVSVRKSVEDPFDDAYNNILSGLKMLEYCRKYRVKKVIYANSAAEVGNPQYLPLDEKHPTAPLSPYGLSKKTFGEYLQLYGKLFGLRYTSLRLANVYGPGQEGSKECGVVPLFISKMLESAPVAIIGDGQQTRDFVYVGDVVEAIIAVLGDLGNGEQYNIGSGKETSVNELFYLIRELAGSGLPPSYSAAGEGELKRCVFSISKAKKEIGWQPQTDLKTGLKKTIDYLNRRDCFKQEE